LVGTGVGLHHHHQRRPALEGDRQQNYEQHHSFFVTKALQSGLRRSHVLESPLDEGFIPAGGDVAFWRRDVETPQPGVANDVFVPSSDKASEDAPLELDDEEGLIDDNEEDLDDELPVDPDEEESDDTEDEEEGRTSASRGRDSDRDEEEDLSERHGYTEPDVVASSELDSSHEDEDVSESEGQPSSSRYHAITRRR
jgi:hypothetical protein